MESQFKQMNFNSNITKLVLQSYPQLTTNLKFMVEDDSHFYLNSITASHELNSNNIQKVNILDSLKVKTQISNFWKNANLTNTSLYYVGDSSLYSSGPRNLNNV